MRANFIPPADIKTIQELVRYRTKPVESRTAEVNRLGKALEDGSAFQVLRGSQQSCLADSW